MTSDEERELLDAVAQLSFDVMAQLGEVGSQHRLSATQIRILGILRDREPRMSELAERLGLDRSTVSGLVDGAVRRGHVERFPDTTDGRVSRIRLTPEGQRFARQVGDELATRISARTQALSAAERRTLRTLLERTQP